MSAESINNWIIIYRGYSPAQLAADRIKLQEWLSNPYNAQGQGSKTYERDREAIVAQLAALQRVLNESSGQPCIGQMDASGGVWPSAGDCGVGLNGFPNSTGW